MDELHRKEDYCEEAQGSERQKAVDNLCDYMQAKNLSTTSTKVTTANSNY